MRKIVDKKIKFKDKLDSRIAKETAFSFLLKVSQAGFSFLTTVLLARILGAEGYGIYAYAYAFVNLFSIPAQAGLPQLVVRETARGMAEGRPEVVKGIWRWATKVVGIISFIFIVVGCIYFLFKGNKLGVKEWTFLWALLLVPFMCLGNLRGAALRGLHKVVIGQLPEFFIRPFLFLAFLCIWGFFFHQKLGPPQVMAFNILAAALAFIVGAWLLYRNIPSNMYKTKPTYEGKRWLGSLIPLAVIASMWIVNSQADIVILGFLKSSKDVGIYRVAVQIAMLSSFGLQAVNSVVAPRFAALYVREEMLELQKIATRSAQLALSFNFMFTIFIVLFGKVFLSSLFGEDFLSAYIPLLILFVGQLVNSAVGPVGFLLNMTGHEKDTARGMILATCVNVILNFFLIPSLGTKGAAIATAISMIIWNMILWQMVRNRLGINSLALNFG